MFLCFVSVFLYGYFDFREQVGTKVFLKSLIKHNRDVALATIISCDPKFKLDGAEIGNEYWVVHVDMALVKTDRKSTRLNSSHRL